MGIYLYAVAATGRVKVEIGGGAPKQYVFPMVYRWKYWPWTYNNDAPPIRQSFNIARIERNAQRAIQNKDFSGLVAEFGIEKGARVFWMKRGECVWNDSQPFPGDFLGYLDQRVEDGSWYLRDTPPAERSA